MGGLHVAPHLSMLKIDQLIGSSRQAVASDAVLRSRRGKTRSGDKFQTRLLLGVHEPVEPLMGIQRVTDRQRETRESFHRAVGDGLRASEQIDERVIKILEA